MGRTICQRYGVNLNWLIILVSNILSYLLFKYLHNVHLFWQVLHHLENGNGTFNQLQASIQNAYNVLEPDGLLLVVCQVERDIFNNWYCQINTNITNKYVQKFAPEDVYMNFFRLARFKTLQMTKFYGKLLADHDRLDGPLEKSWRACDSYWTVASEDEIKDVEQKIAAMKANNTLQQWVKTSDHTSTDGCATLFVCKK